MTTAQTNINLINRDFPGEIQQNQNQKDTGPIEPLIVKLSAILAVIAQDSKTGAYKVDPSTEQKTSNQSNDTLNDLLDKFQDEIDELLALASQSGLSFKELGNIAKLLLVLANLYKETLPSQKAQKGDSKKISRIVETSLQGLIHTLITIETQLKIRLNEKSGLKDDGDPKELLADLLKKIQKLIAKLKAKN